MVCRNTAISFLATALTSSYAMANGAPHWYSLNDTWCLSSVVLHVCLPSELQLDKADSERLRFMTTRVYGPATFLTFFYDADVASKNDRFPRQDLMLIDTKDAGCAVASTSSYQDSQMDSPIYYAELSVQESFAIEVVSNELQSVKSLVDDQIKGIKCD